MISVRRVAKLIHYITGSTSPVRLDELTVVSAPLLLRLDHVLLGRAYLRLTSGSDSCGPSMGTLICGKGGVLRERVVVAILDRAVVYARIHNLALLAAVHQVVFIYVFRDGLLAGRLRATALAHRGRVVGALSVLSAGNTTAYH